MEITSRNTPVQFDSKETSLLRDPEGFEEVLCWHFDFVLAARKFGTHDMKVLQVVCSSRN